MYVLSPSCSSSAKLLSLHCLLAVLYFGFRSCRGDICHWRRIMWPYLLPTFSALGLHPESRQSLCDTDVFIDLFRFSFFFFLYYFILSYSVYVDSNFSTYSFLNHQHLLSQSVPVSNSWDSSKRNQSSIL